MSSSISTTGPNTTITFAYTASTTTMVSIVGDAARYIWDSTGGDVAVFTAMTNAQKVALVEEYIRKTIVDLANVYKLAQAQAETKATQEASKYSL